HRPAHAPPVHAPTTGLRMERAPGGTARRHPARGADRGGEADLPDRVPQSLSLLAAPRSSTSPWPGRWAAAHPTGRPRGLGRHSRPRFETLAEVRLAPPDVRLAADDGPCAPHGLRRAARSRRDGALPVMPVRGRDAGPRVVASRT